MSRKSPSGRLTDESPRRALLTTLRLVRESSFPSPDSFLEGAVVSASRSLAKSPVRSPRDVFALMSPFAAREIGESFWILTLDSQHRLSTCGPTVITRGILTASLVHPREVFCAAIVASAAAIVLCHNHPSGDPTPSSDDRSVTDQLVAAGRLLDIPVHDHVIIGAGRYVSFAEAGFL